LGKNKTLVIALGGLAVLLLVVVVIVLTSSGESQEEQEMLSQREYRGPSSQDGSLEMSSEDLADELERYKKWAQYPPYARPLLAGQVDLLDPYNPTRPPVGVIVSPAAGCEKTEDGLPRCTQKAVFSDVKCDLTPQSAISLGKADFRIELRCFNNEGNVAVSDLKVRVYRNLFRQDIPSLPPVAVGDTGSDGDMKAGDMVYTILVRPTEKDWGMMYAEIDAMVKGHRHNQRAAWFSTPHKVLEFRQGVRDALDNGHLVVSVPVQVIKPGFYHIDANLVQDNPEKTPVAYVSFEGELEAGAQTVNLQFWGKIIKDKGLDGPYLVTQLRAKRNNEPITPAMLKRMHDSGQEIPEPNYTEPLEEYAGMTETYRTQPYEARNFSSAEWDSPEKAGRLEMLRQAMNPE